MAPAGLSRREILYSIHPFLYNLLILDPRSALFHNYRIWLWAYPGPWAIMGWAGFFGWPMKAQARRPLSCGASSIINNIKAFNESLGAQAAITVLKIIKNLACARCKKPGYKERVRNAFNNSAMVLCAPRFSLPGYFEVAGDLYVGKIYLGQDPISRFSGKVDDEVNYRGW
jgi:hypothetical protein